jgi:PAS domain S-box-containing protein
MSPTDKNNNDPADLVRLSYEIAMSIGLTLDLNKMLKVALTSYLKNLDCTAVSVFHQRFKKKAGYYYRKIYSIPRTIKNSSEYRMTAKRLSKPLDNDELNKFRKKLPLIGNAGENHFYHLLDLPGFGLLLLIREYSEIDIQIIKNLSSLNAKLAVASNACLQNKELKKAHKSALELNQELSKKTIALEASQKALGESEKKYRTIFENVQDIFFQTDLRGKILEISPSISRYSERGREELLNTPFNLLYQNPSDHTKMLLALNKKSEIEDFELQLKARYGREIYTAVNAHLIFDDYHNPVAIEGLMRDMTVRKRAEKALLESDRIKSDFVSSVSHELRTPLASILGFSSTILRDKKMDEKVKEEFINIIYQESQRLSKLIEDILNISRIESGRVTYHLQRMPFNPILTEVVEVHQMLAEDKGIQLNRDCSDETIEIMADHDAMKQVLTNLLGNAIKFTLNNGKIDVILEKSDSKVIFKISDTGIGIPEEEQQKIFDKFYRVYRPGLEIQGTGLGLSIVKEILDAHQAKIEVSSQENKGTTFKLVFPIPGVGTDE